MHRAFARSLYAVVAAGVLALLTGSPVLAGAASDWSVGYYTPSGRALSLAAADALPDGVATFDFTAAPNTALLVTDHGALKGTALGDDRGKTITATFAITGATSPFTYFGEGSLSNPCVFPANVRLFFQTSNAGGFDFTHFWWSDTAFAVLGNGSFTLTANVSPVGWSDWNGKPAEANAAAFDAAASTVTLIGFSFGGGCFFENGVGTADGSGTFNLNSFSVS
jgi:hypothetical protein